MTADIPLGARVRFIDSNATTSDPMVVAVGTVNGPEIEDYVPVFAERDNGREATTIYVHKSNILEVDP